MHVILLLVSVVGVVGVLGVVGVVGVAVAVAVAVALVVVVRVVGVEKQHIYKGLNHHLSAEPSAQECLCYFRLDSFIHS